jgi:hypothetical protein
MFSHVGFLFGFLVMRQERQHDKSREIGKFATDLLMGILLGNVTDFACEGVAFMADQVLANQEKILANQQKILANQGKIEGNQAKLDRVLANQERILANQEKILAKK